MPPEETISSTSRTGRPANDRWVGERDLDRTITATDLLRHRVGDAKPVGEIAHPGPGFGVRTDDDSSRVKSDRMKDVCDRRHGREIVGLNAGKDAHGCRGAMQMRIDRNDTITRSSEEPANDPLADRFARLESGVLTHVAEIGRNQNEPLGAFAPQRFGGEQKQR